MVLYEGPSMINGEPIVCIATGTHNPSQNKKTGAMVQIWVLPNLPITTLLTSVTDANADEAVCGDCKHRYGSCYVNLAQAPNAIWKKYERGDYVNTKPRDAVVNRAVRLTAYGDPAALPPKLIDKLIKYSTGYTMYTHQWHQPWGQHLKGRAMASVDTIEEYHKAKKLGWKTFRVFEEEGSVLPSETYCPAEVFEISCLDCLRCDGILHENRKQEDISIKVHGASWKKVRFHEAISASA